MSGAREIGAPPEKQKAGSERCKERSEHRLKTESQKRAVQGEVFAPPESRMPEIGGAKRDMGTV